MGDDYLYAADSATDWATDWREEQSFSVEAQGQSLTFYPGGQERFGALLAMIGQARTRLSMFYYIYRDDAAGVRVLSALVEAARRGVRVTLLLDKFGLEAAHSFFDPLRQEGALVETFHARWSHRYLIRNHQKLVIADGQAAMIGGFNIEDSYFAPADGEDWYDLAVTVRGSAVAQFDAWFGEMEGWITQDEARFRGIRSMVKRWTPPGGPVQVLIGGPTRGLSSWAGHVARDLKKGRQLDMAMAYFAPSAALAKRIGRIGRIGEARLILAGKSDNAATIGAARSFYHYLLGQGVRLWEFRRCKLHSKIIVVDDAVYLGSANFDMRSLYLNLELMLRVEDRALADRMRAFLASHRPASHRITRAEHREASTAWNRLRWNLSWFLVAVLDYNVSRRLNLGL